MIFIGYSSKDRYSIVEPMLFHFKHFGMDVWYDFQDMFLGDDRHQTNFLYGIGSSSYIIFVISPHLFESACAMEELAFAKELMDEKRVIFFPVFYNYTPDKLPENLNWVRNLIYNEVKSDTGTRYVSYQIIERIIHDDITKLPYQSLEKYVQNKQFQSEYIAQLFKSWQNVDERNYGVRIGILYSVYQYLPRKKTRYSKAIDYIFTLLQMNETPDHLIYSIFEKSMLTYCLSLLTSD